MPRDRMVRDGQEVFRALEQGRGQGAKQTAQRQFDIGELPQHLFIPSTAQPLDQARLVDITAGTSEILIDITGEVGARTVITHFGIFNDGLALADFDFFPEVDGQRIYKFIGDNLANNRIVLGRTADLGNNSLIPAYLNLQPRQRLTWRAENRSAVDTSMGVRVVGYVERTRERTQVRAGG